MTKRIKYSTLSNFDNVTKEAEVKFMQFSAVCSRKFAERFMQQGEK